MKTKTIYLILFCILLSLFAGACAPNGPEMPESAEASGVSEITSEESSAEEVSEPGEESSEEPSEEVSVERSELPNVYYDVAAGKKYTVTSSAYRTDGFGDFDDEEGKSPRYKLTDGQVASSGDSTSIGGYSAKKISIVIDLESVCCLKNINADIYGGKWGISTPDKIKMTVYTSTDDVKYTERGTISPSLGNASISDVGEWKYSLFELKLNDINARYIRVDITSPDHIWTSEIKAIGSPGEDAELTNISKIYIETIGGDRVHRSSYHGCRIVVYDPSGKSQFIDDPNGEIKVRGNSTSSGAKQPYNIKFESKQNVLGLGNARKWYLLANMYDKTQLRNILAFTLAQEIGMAYVQNSTFAELYLNGEYRGIYQVCESIGVGSARVDLDTEANEFLLEFEPWPQYSNPEWIVTPRYHITLGFNDPESPTEEQRKYIEDFFDKAEKAIAASDFEEISKYLDIQSFVDAFIVQEFFKQVDYATSSTRFYIKDGKLYEGPVWDFDLSSGNCSSTYYTGYNNVSTTGLSWQGDYCYGIWNSRLFRCKEFERLVKERYKELQPLIVNVYKDNEIGKNLIDSLLEEFRDDIDRNYTVWSTKAVYSELEKIPEDGTYDSEIAYLRNWLENRNAWMCERYGINADEP